MPLVVALIALGGLFLGYRFYGRYLADKIWGLRDDETVPSTEFEDGVDYVPTDKHVLWGHHFASIAGAAPILGPAMAIVWGWVPAMIWIVLGVVFMGAAHDFGALVLSIRHDGKSVGSLAERFIGPRARLLFLLVIFFLIWMVGAVFAFAIANLFSAFPASILPVNLEILVAMVIGWWAFKKKGGILIPSIAALIGLYVVIFGTASGMIPSPEKGSLLASRDTWLLPLMLYSFVASSLPVWLLLQPRDLINSHQLLVGLAGLYLGFFLSGATFGAPPVGELSQLPVIVPLLFVTVACGAISGFHGLVSSGTTSKQLARATDARPVGYGGMLAEGSLAIFATLAVAAGVIKGDEHVWHGVYQPIVDQGRLPEVGEALGGFVKGSASMLAALGIPASVGATVVAVLVISFAATSLDTAFRIQRIILAELGGIFRFKPLENRWVGGAVAAGSCYALIVVDNEAQGKSLWPVFGATNQVLAAITLLLCALYLRKAKKKYWPYLAPAIFVMGITFVAMGVQVMRDLRAENYLVGVTGAIIAVLTAWVALEGGLGFRRAADSS
jgi:carbon starvation protein